MAGVFEAKGLFYLAGQGGGGGDQHNKGYYLTPEALRTAYPTAEAGDFAIVESTDTVWVWDSDTTTWKDGDQKGQVTSVNNQTGDVTVQETLVSGTNIKTINGNSVLGSGDITTETIQVSTMPTAGVDELGKVYQFVGTTDANYTNGYFYKCVSDGGNPATYSWEQVDVQPAVDPLPDQTGHDGEFLTTNGIGASWASLTQTPATMPTLVAANWSSNTQTINVSGVTATNTVFVAPAPVDAADYAAAGIICTGQALGTLTFTCDTTPANDLQVNIVIM